MHQIGLPYHWGRNGLVTGDSANDLFALVADPNVHIQESKAATCDIRPGRRPRGPALPRLLEDSAARGDKTMKLARTAWPRPATATEAKPTNGLLHRHDALHRLQGVRGRVQGVEPLPDDGLLHRRRTTTRARSAPTPGATSRSSSSAGASARDGGSLVQSATLAELIRRPASAPTRTARSAG